MASVADHPAGNHLGGHEPRQRFTSAADVFLAVCEDADAKRKAGQALLNVLVDLWDRYPFKAFHYRDCLFFASQANQRVGRGGDGVRVVFVVAPHRRLEYASRIKAIGTATSPAPITAPTETTVTQMPRFVGRHNPGTSAVWTKGHCRQCANHCCD